VRRTEMAAFNRYAQLFDFDNAKNGLKRALQGLNMKRCGKGRRGPFTARYDAKSGVFLRGSARWKKLVFNKRYAKPNKNVIKYDINFSE
jgi:hypothetical protein